MRALQSDFRGGVRVSFSGDGKGELLSGRFLDEGWLATVDCGASLVSKHSCAVVIVGNVACVDNSSGVVRSILAKLSVI